MKRINKISILFTALLLAGYSKSQIITVTLQVSKDMAIGYHDGANTSGNNYGSAIQNAAYVIPAVANPAGYNGNRALIDFNLNVIPPGATLISASLNLYALGPFGSVQGHFGTANASYLQRITQSWGEYTATWNNQPPSVTQNQITLNQSTSATQDYLNINAMALVQDMLSNPSSSYGFLLKLVNEVSTNGLAFASKDHSNSSIRPTLVISYRQCTEPITVSIGTLPSTLVCSGSSVQLIPSGANSYTWTGSQQVTGQTSSVVVSPTITSVYTVYGSAANGCQGSAQVVINVQNCTGIETQNLENSEVILYPNPNAGTFTIRYGSDERSINAIEITDIQGKLIRTYETLPTQNSVDVSDLGVQPGIYFCRTLNGNTATHVIKICITQ